MAFAAGCQPATIDHGHDFCATVQGESTPFIIFMLEAILQPIQETRLTDQENDQVIDQVARLLVELKNGARSTIELMAALGLSHRPSFRNNYIRPGLSAGLIEMAMPGSPTARNQKYRLTVRGQMSIR